MSPKRPMADPKISTMRILTKSVESAASARAAPDPTWPTQIPQKRLTRPVVSPAPNMVYPANQFFLLRSSLASMMAGLKWEHKNYFNQPRKAYFGHLKKLLAK